MTPEDRHSTVIAGAGQDEAPHFAPHLTRIAGGGYVPLLYSIEGPLVFIRVIDRVSFADTVDLTTALLADPAFEATADMLVDASRSRPSLSYAEMRTTATRWVTLAGRLRRIAIVAPDDIIYALARVFQLFAERAGLTCQVSRTMTEARTWLAQGVAASAGSC